MNRHLEPITDTAQPTEMAEKSDYSIYHEGEEDKMWMNIRRFYFICKCQLEVILHLFTHKNYAFQFVLAFFFIG